MQKEHETEQKFLARKEQFYQYFESLVNKYGKAVTNHQVNYYYDTENNTLNKNNVTVRIRQERDGMKWQVKKHFRESNLLLSSDEYSGSIEELPQFLKICDINEKLFLKGSLMTERRIINFGVGSKLCFDINMYLGVIDYEIEVEYLKQDKQCADDIVAIIGSVMEPTTITKSSRFFKQWEETNNGKAITLH